VGNDLVLRVPGNDRLSARISRRHLEVRLSGEGFVVIDRSKAGTLRNGRPLVRDTPTPVRAGDRLSVAGVISLEVAFEAGPAAGGARARAEGGRAAVVGPVLLEATLGDVVTLE
jgi:predicted component of type VI protein secretion system